MKPFTKKLIEVVENNVRFENLPDGYIVFQDKHLTERSLWTKMAVLEDFARKVRGEIRILKRPYIHGDERRIVFYLTGNVIHMKKFDTLIKDKTHIQTPKKSNIL